jgi:hypothetical protein
MVLGGSRKSKMVLFTCVTPFYMLCAEESMIRIFDVTHAPYSANGNGVDNDLAAFKAAIADASAYAVSTGTAGTVLIPPGVYDLGRDGSLNWSLRIPSNVTLMGFGKSSVIRLLTSATASDWHLLRVDQDATNVTIRDLALNGKFPVGSPISGLTEQTHLIRLGGGNQIDQGCSSIRIYNVHFSEVRGDGIQCVGANNGLGGRFRVQDVIVENCTFDACHRSGISIQRECHNFTIRSCTFHNTNDQDIDFEPTGNGTNGGFDIDGNLLDRTLLPTRIGTTSVSLVGIGAATERLLQSSFRNNRIIGGFLFGFNVTGLDITGNTFDFVAGQEATAVIRFFRGCADINISGNKVYRRFNGVGGDGVRHDPGSPCIDIGENNSVKPTGITVTNNHFHTWYGDGMAVSFESANDVTCANNHVYRHASTSNLGAGIAHRTSISSSAGSIISGNHVHGGQGFAQLTLRTAATAVLTITSSNAQNDETVTIDGHVYTWKTTLTGAADQVLIGTREGEGETDQDVLRKSRTNLWQAIVAYPPGAGVHFGAGTAAHAVVIAGPGNGAGAVNIRAKVKGTAGNSLALAETMANGSWSGSTLSGGAQTTDNLDCILAARNPGAAGNSITIETVADGEGTGNWAVSGNAITFHFKSGVTTKGDFLTALQNTGAVRTLLVEDPTREGLGADVPMTTSLGAGDVFGPTALSGGGGSYQYGILVGGANEIDDVTINGNNVDGIATHAIQLHGTATFMSYPAVIGNRTETVIGNLANAAQAVLIGGNEQQPILQGSGTPENNINAPVGAWFMRTDTNTDGPSGVSASLYVKRSNFTNSSGWVAVA